MFHEVNYLIFRTPKFRSCLTLSHAIHTDTNKQNDCIVHPNSHRSAHQMVTVTLIVLASQHGCMTNTTDCTYSKLPADDEHLTYSKHVVDNY